MRTAGACSGSVAVRPWGTRRSGVRKCTAPRGRPSRDSGSRAREVLGRSRHCRTADRKNSTQPGRCFRLAHDRVAQWKGAEGAMSLTRFVAVAKKEIVQVLRDTRSLIIVLGMPVILVLLFGYGVWPGYCAGILLGDTSGLVA